MRNVRSLALCSKSNPSRTGQEGASRLINCYAEPLGVEGKAAFALYAINGLVQWATIASSGPIRALLAGTSLRPENGSSSTSFNM